MCSTIEPRRATVSCKNLFTPSNNNERSRRYIPSNAHSKRLVTVPTTGMPLKQSNVFHIPFAVEPTHEFPHSKALRTRLNPLSPAFFSTKQPSLNVESKLSNECQRSVVHSETSDYGSGTDPDQQSIQHSTPASASSAFTFDIDEGNLLGSSSTHSSSLRRTSLSSSSSSSSTSSPTSPSSSISNLSSLSSSSEFQRSFPVQNRFTSKKNSSTANSQQSHGSTSNEIPSCSCNKENQPMRKRNRSSLLTSRRAAVAAAAQPSTTINSTCQNCQAKRTKLNGNGRNKQSNKRQRAQQLSQASSPSTTSFTVNLTGLNIHYTVEYHEPMKCTYYPLVLPHCNPYSPFNRCRCLSSPPSLPTAVSTVYEWHPAVSPSYAYHPSEHYPSEIYYVDTNWISQPVTPLYNYYDFYFTKYPSEHLSTISFVDPFPSESDLDSKAIQPPPNRSWLRLSSPAPSQSTAIFTVMNYNILCDKYANGRVYKYCPSWALQWDYRRKQILDELHSYSADIIALQEIETDQFNSYFLPELGALGYDGVFSPKSRARTMCEKDRRSVDGCAIFYRQSKFRLIKDYLVEFNQLAMSAGNTPACHDMMNRVMTKDNIGLVALLETKDEIYSSSSSRDGVQPSAEKQMLFVCTAHIHWDPEYCDVKVIQTSLLLSELKTIMEDAIQKHRTHPSISADCTSVPLVLCGDFNSLPDSGVIQLMRDGKISMNHADFKDLRYDSFLQRISRLDATTTSGSDIVHPFKLQSAYETTSSPIMPYTNYTSEFKGIIDYVFYSTQLMRVLGVLGPVDPDWLQKNKIVGCPQPNVPSDHFSLLVEFELNRLPGHPKPNQDIAIESSVS